MAFNPISALMVSLVFLLGACASPEPPAANPDSPAATAESPGATPPATDTPAADTTPSPAATDHSMPQQGGQVVEVGNYHLELVAVPETDKIHLDLFLQTGDTHESIESATVTGQVQLPDGSQTQVAFEYDAEGEHYVAFLPETASGEYKVTILTDISGEKVNGRFSFIQ